jgi:hypothetical protein
MRERIEIENKIEIMPISIELLRVDSRTKVQIAYLFLK